MRRSLVVKARFQGREAYFLIHIETQSWPQGGFPERMFDYFVLLRFKFRLPIYPIAIFSYDAPLRPEPDEFNVTFPDFEPLRFKFKSIQLNRLDWREFIRKPNPVAAALMTKMHIAPEDRPRVKLECMRMIATLKLDKARAALIGMFMEAYLKLTAEENLEYNRELRTILPQEQDAVMQYTNPWIEEGKALGRHEGRLEGRQDLILRQLRRRFGTQSDGLAQRIRELSEAKIEELSEELLVFESLVDAQIWLGTHA